MPTTTDSPLAPIDTPIADRLDNGIPASGFERAIRDLEQLVRSQGSRIDALEGATGDGSADVDGLRETIRKIEHSLGKIEDHEKFLDLEAIILRREGERMFLKGRVEYLEKRQSNPNALGFNEQTR
jgi:hypothetical protein